MPSESEWEYAVRAGNGSRYHFGDDESKLCRYGNVADTTELPNGHVWTNRVNCSDGAVYPVAVGSYRPNAFGLYDMHGNVAEWVADCYHEDYEGAPSDGSGSVWTIGCFSNPVVLRGGTWSYKPRHLRAEDHSWNWPSYRGGDGGFRLVRVRLTINVIIVYTAYCHQPLTGVAAHENHPRQPSKRNRPPPDRHRP